MYRRLCILLFASSASLAQETSTIQYLANEGVMVTHGDTKVPFDPLYQNGFNNYQMVPNEVREAMFAGTAPFDGVDAVFVSHYHGDHFSAEDILRLLRSQIDTKLYAPAQAVREIRQVAGPDDESIFDRVIGLDLDYGDAPVGIDRGALTIDAVHIPHSGWPTARTDVQNIAFRVTLENNSTVLHLGDADARIVHFATDAEYWEERTIDVAFPPYWFLGSDDGIEILENRMSVGHSIGIHVPANFSDPANIPGEFSGVDLFTKPGERRRFAGKQ